MHNVHDRLCNMRDCGVNWWLRSPGKRQDKAVYILEKCGFVPSGTIGEEGPRFYKEKDYL